MTKVYELPNGHRMVADIDESTRVCNITETTLDSLVSKLNYYAEQTDVLDKIRAEIQENINYNKKMNYQGIVAGLLLTLNIIGKYRGDADEVS